MTDPLGREDAPKFNDDFSNYFMINNLPETNEEKIPKLKQLIIKTLTQNNYKTEEN